MNSTTDLLILLIILAVIGALMLPRRWRGSGTSGGTARFAVVDDLQQAGMLSGAGLLLGQLRDGTLVRMPNVVHTAVFAPTGAGKSSSLLVPWLRKSIRGSSVNTDPKGELHRLTAEWQRARGIEPIRLDPFEVCGPGSHTYDPLSVIPDGPRCIDDAHVLAETMVIRTGRENDLHWNNSAANGIRGLLSLILADVAEPDRNLLALRDIVTDFELCMACVAKMKKKGGAFARLAGVIEQWRSTEEGGTWTREGASVMSVINENTTFLDSPAIAGNIAKSNFDPRKLLTGKMSIYIILPPPEMEAQARWMRMVIASLVRLVMREGTQENK